MKITRQTLALSLITLIMLTLAGCGNLHPSAVIGKTNTAQVSTPTTQPTPLPLVSHVLTGFSRPSWGQGQYGSAEEQQSFLAMLADNPNCVGVIVTKYLLSPGSTKIVETVYTASADDIAVEIKQIHQAGKCVFFAPHVDYMNNNSLWGANIGDGFTDDDWHTFEQNYTAMIMQYAQMCQQLGCDLLSIGNEFVQFSQKNDYWIQLIPQIRSVFTGQLTYSAWGDGEQKKITWWNLLDYIGINPWIAIADEGQTDPSPTEIATYWDTYLPSLLSLVLLFHKPILFTEIGYDSYQGMSANPWREPTAQDTPDQEEQANAFLVMFQKMSGQRWFAGLFIWYWPILPSQQPFSTRDVSVNGKKAEKIISTWFTMLGSPTSNVLQHP